jgi:hypothetical protein
MSIKNQSIKEFQEIYKEEFGKEISKQKALELATNLINLYKIIYPPSQKTEVSKNYEITSKKI